MKKDKSNIIKYPRGLNMNMGLILFFVIFVYMVINIYNFYTQKHTSYYEVDAGSIQMRTSYTALALREEKVVYSYEDGFVNYYLKDNSKAKKGSLIASVDETGEVSSRISSATDHPELLNSDILSDLSTDIYNYIGHYNSNEFYEIYRFSDDLNASLMEAVNLSFLNTISDYAVSSNGTSTFHLDYSSEPGIVSYSYDGYESVTVDNFTPGMFDKSSMVKESLKGREKTNSGDPLYKIITSDDWNLVIKVDDTLYELIKDESVIKVRFKSDETTAWAYISTREIGSSTYLILSLSNSMVRYASERFIDIELVTDKKEGLKIPNSAITQKNFFTVPDEYFVYGGSNGATKGLTIETVDEDGKKEITFVGTDICYTKDGLNYISDSRITKGTVIINPNGSGENITAAANANLEGVYNLNKGYAVFRIIDKLYSNKEYSIIARGTPYGLYLYDHIALDASQVNENEIIKY